MKLQDIFRQLTSGELSQVSLGGGVTGSIPEEHWGKVVDHVNLGLTALFSRFKLKENSTLVTLVPNQNTYPLTPVDLLKVERVATDTGCELPLNDNGNAYSVHTPDTYTLWVPKPIVNGGPDLPDMLKTVNLKVSYRAGHPQIVMGLGYFDPERVDVMLPQTYLQALLYYVASRVHNPIGMTNEFNAGNNWAAKYEMECQRLENSGLAIDATVTNDRLTRNGWV